MTRWSYQGVIHGEITTMPGCTQIGISHAVYSINPGSGKGALANGARCEAMHGMGYDYALCTVDVQNEAQLKILRQNGWRCLDTFRSRKTGHHVAVYGKDLYTYQNV